MKDRTCEIERAVAGAEYDDEIPDVENDDDFVSLLDHMIANPLRRLWRFIFGE